MTGRGKGRMKHEESGCGSNQEEEEEEEEDGRKECWKKKRIKVNGICDESHPLDTFTQKSEFFRSFLQVPFLENTCDSITLFLLSLFCLTSPQIILF